MRFYCFDCEKPFTTGRNGQMRESGPRCFPCLRAAFGDDVLRKDPVARRWLEKAETTRAAHYGLQPDEVQALIASQGGRCAICSRTPHDGAHHVDHDHKTGAVRGILCSSCNTGLGLLGDTVESLRRAVAYLENPPAQ